MTNIEFEITDESTTVYDEYDLVLLTVPTPLLLNFIEAEDLNQTGETEQSYFEERNDEGGFSYTPIDIHLRENSREYLESNTETVTKAYLKDLLENYEEYKKIK